MKNDSLTKLITKKTILTGLVAGATLSSLLGCNLQSILNKNTEPYSTQKSCESAGGVWDSFNIGQERGCYEYGKGCRFPTADYGASCTNSSECEGECILRLFPPGKETQPYCSEFIEPDGCLRIFSEDGRERIRCIDTTCPD